MTRSRQTEDCKNLISSRLVAASCRDLGCEPSELTATMMANWMIWNKTEWSPSTWRQYRAAVSVAFGSQISNTHGRRTAVRGVQPTLRTWLHHRHLEPAIRRVDFGVWLGTSDRRTARQSHRSRPHSGDERRELPSCGFKGTPTEGRFCRINHTSGHHRSRQTAIGEDVTGHLGLRNRGPLLSLDLGPKCLEHIRETLAADPSLPADLPVCSNAFNKIRHEKSPCQKDGIGGRKKSIGPKWNRS